MDEAISRPPLILFEDDDLLVINKPAGMNTHAPAPFAGEGIFEWLRDRQPHWANLAIIQRLDKETSGVMTFAKSSLSNRSLTEQFSSHTVEKAYVLLTDRPVPRAEWRIESNLQREGDKYVSRPHGASGERAETVFRVRDHHEGRTLVEARPLTGRTHQIRAQAAAAGFPVLGDELYGGTAGPRIFLHSESLTLRHPATRQTVTFDAAADFEADGRTVLRSALLSPVETDTWRVLHGTADGWPGWYVDRFGNYLLSQSENELGREQRAFLESLAARLGTAGIYHKRLERDVGARAPRQVAPQYVSGTKAPSRFMVRENGLSFEVSFEEGYSVGLFLDQRDNRRRLLRNHIAGGFPVFAQGRASVLNTFAYTCAFSACAARSGAEAVSVDLSEKYLDWGKRNFAANDLEQARHEFLTGDVFDWLRRLSRKGRSFDLVILDPPTFSRSKHGGVFQAQMDYGRLVRAALPLLNRGGVLFASTNAAGWKPEEFVATVEASIGSGGRAIQQRHYATQPPDFRVSRSDPAYLKTLWLKVA